MAVDTGFARQVVELLETAIANYYAGQPFVSELSINGRTIRYRSITEMEKSYSFWKTQAGVSDGGGVRVAKLRSV